MAALRLSLNEVHRAAQRALEGAGAPHGVDRDGAQAVAWLEARGLPGLALLDASLGQMAGTFAPPPAPRRRAGGAAIDLAGRPALVWAGALVDCLRLLNGEDGVSRLELAGCRWPLALLPEAAQQAAPGRTIELRWQVGPIRVAAVAAVDGACRIALGGGPVEPRRLFLDPAPADTTMETSRGVTRAVDRPGAAVVLDAGAFERALEDSLAHGVAVEAALWQRISAAAQRVLVPASAESRARGAGGGDANA